MCRVCTSIFLNEISMRALLIATILLFIWAGYCYGETDKNDQMIDHGLGVKLEDKIKDSKDLFTRRIRGRFQIWLQNSQQHISMIKEIFNAHGLPEELAYLPLIESGFCPYSVSPAGAVGLWQFMEGTARRYGLRIDEYIDERRDPYKSTAAAVRYLNNLYNIFGSWGLVLLSYNAGEGRIARISHRVTITPPITYNAMARKIARTGIDATTALNNFFNSRRAPHETRRYIPQFIAAVTIAQNPEKYGFTIKEEESIEYKEVTVRNTANLRNIARKHKTKVSVLRRLNPALLTNTVPRGYKIRVPSVRK